MPNLTYLERQGENLRNQNGKDNPTSMSMTRKPERCSNMPDQHDMNARENLTETLNTNYLHIIVNVAKEP